MSISDYLMVPSDELYGAKAAVAALYCDGGCIGSSRSTEGGAWAYCHVTAKGISILDMSGMLIPTVAWPDVTNNYAEYIAALRALESMPDGWSGKLCSDSGVTLGRIGLGWANNNLPPSLQRRMEIVIKRLGSIETVLLDGHPTNAELRAGVGKTGKPVSRHNVWADAECSRLMAVHTIGTKGAKKDGD